jgi:hypothetical protein
VSYLVAGPDSLTAAASDLAEIGSAISGATDAASAATTGLLPAAADEVSTQIAEFFASHADQYRAVSAQAAAFHSAFVRAVEAGAASYANAEAANRSLLQQATDASGSEIALIMGGTFNPQPTPGYVAAINSLFIQSNPSYTGYSPFGLYTPESGGVIPLVSGLTLDQSVVQGEIILNNAIMNAPAGSHTLVFGWSQSACIGTLEMNVLDALPPSEAPSPSNLSFMFIGNGDTPNGGIFSRFSFNIPGLDISTYGPMPPNTPYPTTIYTSEYDGLANFPQYPLDIVADLNALAGAVYVHPQYAFLTPAQLQSAVPLATSPGYYADGGVTHYYMIPDQNLPLLDPIRAIPVVGTPLADLLQPDLRVLVNLGYNPNGYANIPTGAQLWPGFSPVDDFLRMIPPPYNELIWQPDYTPSPLPDNNPLTIWRELVIGGQQGVTDALVDIGVLPQSYYATTYPAINDLAKMTAIA